MYNYMLAFVICAVAYIASEYVSNATKAGVPSVFVTAAMMLVGYWTIFPNSLVADSNLIPFGSSIAMYLIVTHMGTVISFKQLFAQWKTIVVCLAGLVGMAVLALVICPMVIEREFVVTGLPPLTGGLVAATIMSDAAKVLQPTGVVNIGPIAIGEDFGLFLEKVPGALALVGVGNEACGAIWPQHSPKYTVDEDALLNSVMLYAQVALDHNAQ